MEKINQILEFMKKDLLKIIENLQKVEKDVYYIC